MYPIDKKILAAKLAHNFLLTLSFAAFLYQVYEFADEYFAYKTITKVTLVSSNSVPPALSLCIRYSDIMDWESFMHESSNATFNHCPRRSAEFREYSRSMTFPTIAEIFEFTPNANESLDAVLFRTPGKFKMTRVTGAKVYSYFEVTKYYVQEYMCYNFFIRDQRVVNFDRIVSSLTNSRMIYKLSLSNKLKGANRLQATIFYQDDAKDFPGYSKMFGAFADRLEDINKVDKPLANEFLFSYSVHKMHGLEAPYDTMCRPRGPTFDCMHSCLSDGYKKINRSPFQIFHDMDMDLSRRHVNNDDLINKTISQLVVNIDDKCNKRCTTTICSVSFTRTDFAYMYQWDDGLFMFDIVVMAPNKPDTIMESVPMMSFSDLVYFVCGSFTIWFGVSVYCINPFKRS
jgi:hypothetical protein